MPAIATLTARDPEAVADALDAHGACALTDLPDAQQGLALGSDLLRLQRDGALRDAQVGQGHGRQRRVEVRGDAIVWLDDPRCGPAAAAHLQALETLRAQLNRLLLLGIDEVEAHYASYPPGAGYLRHADRFHGSQARVLSLVGYLNAGWQDEDGGALRLHLPSGPVDILPRLGTGVCFRSEIEHEVLPARRERRSIAAWMRTRSE